MSDNTVDATLTEDFGTGGAAPLHGFTLTVVDADAGSGAGAPKSFAISAERCSIGSASNNDVVIEDPTLSRYHCELRVDARGARVRDLGSRNGTFVDGTRVLEAFLKGGSLLRMGRPQLRFDLAADTHRPRLSAATRFGALVGTSVPMRAAFALLERAAGSDATVLLEGETGTGKGAAAEAIHHNGARAAAPFLVVDCAALPAPLLESELFGHERGAFTGADTRRVGAFEEADGGTIFLDEIGELPAELQPKLLRVLESREIRRLGQNAYRTVDVRVIAATHRDLRAEVNAGRFRADLYFRLAVLRVTMPALRQRPEDLPAIAEQILTGFGARHPRARELLTPELTARLAHAAWPGNVRELRNYLERCVVLEEPLPLDGAPASPGAAAATPQVDAAQPYADARDGAIEAFERAYVEALLRLHKGNVSAAARAAGITRVYLYRLLGRHGLTPR
ncbi:MAG: sigma 54-interacting transcriptional regulator [Deltaproteobacteria bacterium]|nr:sigma 54-interacting transcriptional regulator [Deltaproteobacteria bacterium]